MSSYSAVTVVQSRQPEGQVCTDAWEKHLPLERATRAIQSASILYEIPVPTLQLNITAYFEESVSDSMSMA